MSANCVTPCISGLYSCICCKLVSTREHCLLVTVCSLSSVKVAYCTNVTSECRDALHAGFTGNQLIGGLLLHTTRNTYTKSCDKEFSKFLTSCVYNHTLYDAATGEVVVLATTTGGLLPYGVDTFFLESSSTYDSSLAVCEHPVGSLCPSICMPVLYTCEYTSCPAWTAIANPVAGVSQLRV